MASRPSRLQLSVRAEGLKNLSGVRGKSDPYATLSISGGIHDGTVIGRTETIKDCLSPQWTRKLFIEFYSPGVYAPVSVQVFDDRSGKNEDDKKMGEATFEISEILYAPGREIIAPIEGRGRLSLHIDDSVKGSDHGSFRFHLRALDLKNVESGLLGLGVADPFYEVHRKFSDHGSGIARWVTVYRSEPIEDTLNPVWDMGTIGTEELCHCDLDWPLLVTVLDWEKSGRHRTIGGFETTARILMDNVSVRGNADREKAIKICLGDSADGAVWGLMVVLNALVVS